MVSALRPAWVAPTVRACRSALLTAAAVSAAAAAAAVAAGAYDVALPTPHVWLALAALAVAAATPHDPAAGLLAALPSGPGRRLIHRGAIGTLAAFGAWILAGWGVHALVTPPASDAAVGGSPSSLLALVVVAVVAGRWFGPWGACTPLVLIGAGQLVDGGSRSADVLQSWWTHPWIVVAIALAAGLVHHRTQAADR